MALINCPECGNQISDKAASCPHCGNPISNSKPEYISKSNGASGNNYGLLCPACLSSNVMVTPKGFSGKKALAGAVAVGSLGLLAGTHGNNDLICNCVACGHKFEPKNAVKENDVEFWNEIDGYLRKGDLSGAIAHYNIKKGVAAEEVLKARLRKVNPGGAQKAIDDKNKSDMILCLIGIAFFIIIAIITCVNTR